MIEVDIRILVPLPAGKAGSQKAFLQRSRFRNMDGLTVELRAPSLLRGKQLVSRGIVNGCGDALAFVVEPLVVQSNVFQSNRHAENRKSVREVRRAVERINIPAILAALVAESLLFAQNVVGWPLLPDAFPDQDFSRAVSRRYQIGFAFVFDLQVLVEVIHQQSTRFAGDR